MNDTEAILAELRKISAWAEMQRKLARRTLVGLAILVPVMIILFAFLGLNIIPSVSDSTSHLKFDWYDVDQKARAGDLAKAVGMGEQLALKEPQSPEVHRRLADVYLAAGKLQEAREQYAEARRLFPTEQNSALLMAIDQRIKDETSAPTP
jgi:hypothetical protein